MELPTLDPTMEPYRWLEAVRHRREYIEDQIRGATPVFAISRPEGIYLLGIGLGHSKVFEVFDAQGMAALGNPVDIEKLRHTAIEAAHVDAFKTSAQDVSLRRLINYSLSIALKNSFEQVYSPPLMVESVFAEVGRTQDKDAIFTMSYDGTFQYMADGVAVVASNKEHAGDAKKWAMPKLEAAKDFKECAKVLLTVWDTLMDKNRFDDSLEVVGKLSDVDLEGRTIEAALLERDPDKRVKFQWVDLST